MWIRRKHPTRALVYMCWVRLSPVPGWGERGLNHSGWHEAQWSLMLVQAYMQAGYWQDPSSAERCRRHAFRGPRVYWWFVVASICRDKRGANLRQYMSIAGRDCFKTNRHAKHHLFSTDKHDQWISLESLFDTDSFSSRRFHTQQLQWHLKARRHP